jgi:hypothetical protein
VLAGWSSFGLWCLWVGRGPSVGFRTGEDDDGSSGEDGPGGGGSDDGGPDDGPQGGGDEPPDDDGGIDWDVFERDFAAYVERVREAEPAAD